MRDHQETIGLLREKYDGKNHSGVRAFRKRILLEQNPDIIQELGDQKWIEYLYNTKAEGELEEYKKHLEEKLVVIENMPIEENPDFNPSTGEFSSGFQKQEDKDIAKSLITKEIEDISTVLSN